MPGVVVFDAQGSNSGGLSAISSLAANVTVGNNANRYLLASLSVSAAVTGVTCNFNSLPLTFLDSNSNVWWYYMIAPPVGTFSLAWAWTTARLANMGGISLHNVWQDQPVRGAIVKGSAGSGSPSIVVPSNTDDIVVDGWVKTGVDDDDTSPVAGAGQTAYYSADNGNTLASGMQGGGSREAGAANVTMSWSSTSRPWQQMGASIQSPPPAGFLAFFFNSWSRVNGILRPPQYGKLATGGMQI
jgi:hypothetical protein